MKSSLVVLFVCALFLAGCSFGPHTVVGTWNAEKPGSPGNSITYDFKQDGTFTFVEHAQFQSIKSHQTASGTYHVVGRHLILFTTNEVMGIDADIMAAIDARERIENPGIHIAQDKGDVPVKIEQPTTNFLITYDGDKLKLKDISNYADRGAVFVRPGSDWDD